MVRESNPGGGEIFRICSDRPWGPPSLLYNGYRVPLSEVKRLGCGVKHPPHLAPNKQKELSFPLLALCLFIVGYRVTFTFNALRKHLLGTQTVTKSPGHGLSLIIQ